MVRMKSDDEHVAANHISITLFSKSYYIFKPGPLFLMALYKTKHITCCIICKGIQHHIREHVYKENLITVKTYVIFLRVTQTFFRNDKYYNLYN